MAIQHDAPFQRRHEILVMLQAAPGKTMTLQQLSRQLDRCTRTIRRDAQWLAARQMGVTLDNGVLHYVAPIADSEIEPEDALMARIATAQMLGVDDPAYQRSVEADARTVANCFGHRLELWRYIGQDAHRREFLPAVYRSIIWAIHAGRAIRFSYRPRSRSGAERTHEVCPQALRQWRDARYLIATVNGCCKVFSLDRIAAVEACGIATHRYSEEDLERNVALAYGIFCGEPEDWAHIELDADTAQYSDARWHRNERRTVHPDGRVELMVPYASPRELIATILSLGPGARVVGPQDLANEVASQATAIARRYAA